MDYWSTSITAKIIYSMPPCNTSPAILLDLIQSDKRQAVRSLLHYNVKVSSFFAYIPFVGAFQRGRVWLNMSFTRLCESSEAHGCQRLSKKNSSKRTKECRVSFLLYKSACLIAGLSCSICDVCVKPDILESPSSRCKTIDYILHWYYCIRFTLSFLGNSIQALNEQHMNSSYGSHVII